MAHQALKARKRSDYGYHLSYRTRWSDNDMYHHVNNSVYGFFFDSIINQYLAEQCGRSPKTSTEIGIVVTSACNFFGSVSYPSVIDACMRVNKLVCDTCKGDGAVFKDKDKCKKCKGSKLTKEKKVLELYIPRGAKEGERIVLQGEADQSPDQEPGDLVFVLRQKEHSTFRRAGGDLVTEIQITLAEALCGFSRVVVKHLDGRGISITHSMQDGKVLKPEQVLRVDGEGMPHKKSDLKGDLYLILDIKFPEDGFLGDEETISKLRSLLPGPGAPIAADTVDEVEYDAEAELEDLGARDGQGGNAWEDDDEDEDPQQAQCAQQ